MKRLKADQLKTIGVVVLMIGAYALFVHRPSAQQREAMQEKVETDQKRLAQAQPPDLDALRAALAQERRKLDAERRDLPPQDEIFLVMDGVSGALLDQSIPDHQLSQSDPRRYADYGIQPIDLSFEGGFTETYTALRAMERLPMPVRIERLELLGNADDPAGQVHASVRLSSFYAVGESYE